MKFRVEIQKLSEVLQKANFIPTSAACRKLEALPLKILSLRARVDSMQESLQAKTSLDYTNKSFHILDEFSLSTTCTFLFSFDVFLLQHTKYKEIFAVNLMGCFCGNCIS